MRKLGNPIAGRLPVKYFFKILSRFNLQQDMGKFFMMRNEQQIKKTVANSKSDLNFKC